MYLNFKIYSVEDVKVVAIDFLKEKVKVMKKIEIDY